MDNIGVIALGFIGQGLFGARLIVQLFKSEKAGKVVSPAIFWWLSLGASFIFLLYGIFRHDIVIVGGQLLSFYIYVRNLQLKEVWKLLPFYSRTFLLSLPLVITTSVLLLSKSSGNDILLNIDVFHPIMLLGVIGQLALNLRFVYQWYYSEKFKTSVLPLGFWNISTWASVLVIIYALNHPVHGIDPVLLVAQSLGLLVYLRNIVIFKKQQLTSEPA